MNTPRTHSGRREPSLRTAGPAPRNTDPRIPSTSGPIPASIRAEPRAPASVPSETIGEPALPQSAVPQATADTAIASPTPTLTPTSASPAPRPAASRRGARPLTVQTESLGAVRVRRITLGGVAASAERLRDQADPDGIALVDALIAEATTREGAPLDPTAIDSLTESDRRAIATAMLTLEGVKAGGEDDPMDPRALLARRYHEIVGTRPTVPAAAIANDQGGETTSSPDVGGALPHTGVPNPVAGNGPESPMAGLPAATDPGQIALFELPSDKVRPPAEPARPATPPRMTIEKVSARIDDIARRLEPLETADHTRHALMSASARMDGRIQTVEAGARRLAWGGAIALAAVLVAGIASTAVLSSKLSATRAALDDARTRIEQQERVIEELRRAVLAKPAALEPARAPVRKAPKPGGKASVR